MSPVQDKPASKPRSRKVVQRSKKRDQAQASKLSRDDQEQVSDSVVSAGPAEVIDSNETTLAAAVRPVTDETPPAQEPEPASDTICAIDASPELAAEPSLVAASGADDQLPDHDQSPLPAPATAAGTDQTGIKTLGDEYKNYVSGSVRRAGFLFEKLMAARSFGQAMEVQAEFAKQPCAHVLEGAEIAFKLYGDFTKRILTTWQRTAPGK